MTYLDTCVIERMGDIENPETGITEQDYSPIHDGKLKCALSQSGLGSAGSLPVVENKGTFNITYEDQKLFLMPDVDVKRPTESLSFKVQVKSIFYLQRNPLTIQTTSK